MPGFADIGIVFDATSAGAHLYNDAKLAGTQVVSELSETIIWDTRDQRLNTTKGWMVRNSIAAAGLIGTEQIEGHGKGQAGHQAIATAPVVVTVLQ